MKEDRLDREIALMFNEYFPDPVIGDLPGFVEAIKEYAASERTKAAIEELEKFKEYSYNLGFRGTGMEHLDRRIANLQEKQENPHVKKAKEDFMKGAGQYLLDEPVEKRDE